MPRYLADGLLQLKIPLSDVVNKTEIEFLDELLRWNQRVNLTSITNRSEAIEKHLLDSLLLLPHLDMAKNILDMGSGGGLPSIPLAIAAPSLGFVSVDSVGKKVNFQKHVKRLLQIKNLTILQSRVEELKLAGLEEKSFDLVVSRAFTSLEAFIGYAEPWLKPGGRVLAMKGPEGRDELSSVKKVVTEYHLGEPQVFSYLLPYSRAERQLIVLKKQATKNLSRK
ncbi:MAG: 16S rRNA (guanine(527)-N(7))-methyltransferase RsmG [Desulfuromusa sp.]|jgi:16S rRNA (guanine527-N7)-methyltransferase|nr:16S rRNA (guanine(527)-N(7))-methyltransferase RsmG [Desulfuromusa sp.]